MTNIHSTAIVDPKAEISEDCEIGPWALIGPNVRLGQGCNIGPRVTIEGDTVLGERCNIANGAVIGSAPPGLEIPGEPTGVRIGNDVTIREFATVNRATGDGSAFTVLGNNILVMAYAHVAHDCCLEDDVIMANVATLAGHIHVGKGAIIGGLVAIHQFCHIGRFCIIGGGSNVRKDVMPFITASGETCKPHGLNLIGLKRRGFSEERIKDLRYAYKTIFRGGLSEPEAIEKLRSELPDNEDIKEMIDFIENSQRGISR